MNEMDAALNPAVGGEDTEGVSSSREPVEIPIDNEDESGPTIIEGEPVVVDNEDVGAGAGAGAGAEETAVPLLEAGDVSSPEEQDEPEEPEFDNLRAVTRFLVGSTIEGTVEFTRRLQAWEAYLREEMPEDTPKLSEASEQDLMRYALIGFIFEGGETGRTLLKKLLKVPGGVARTAVRPTKSVANSRLTGPIRRRIDRMADRGQEQVVRWIKRGHVEEPLSRELARLGVQEITDEFINRLAENEELKELVQEQSVGLAGEAVEQVRERTFSADTLVERIARAVTRRSPRLTPPMADLSEYESRVRLLDREGDE
jgi:hypothetical protein